MKWLICKEVTDGTFALFCSLTIPTGEELAGDLHVREAADTAVISGALGTACITIRHLPDSTSEQHICPINVCYFK